jgi:FAD/FMN-containing dehydrogenase
MWLSMKHAAELLAEIEDCGLSIEIDDRYRGDWLMQAGPEVKPLGVVRPKTTAEVSRILSCCNMHGIPVVPQGGLTGLTGASVPSDGALIVSMERMSSVIDVDRISHTITVEAGVPLQRIQEAAEEAGLFFPLDIGSRGSCQIGGNLSTNAGGNRVLRYGMARDMVLGLEAVQADGTIITAMNVMMKNNAGYDLKHLFIGSEGTLGVITRVVLKLFAKPRSVSVALAAFPDYPALESFLGLTRARLGGALTAFEAMWDDFYALATRLTGQLPPIAPTHGCYALIEASASDEGAETLLADLLEVAISQEMVSDAVLAQSLAQADAIWAVRDASGLVLKHYDVVGNFDVSVPTSRIDAFQKDCTSRLRASWPEAEINWFGHVVDGNLHLIMSRFPESALHEVEETTYATVRDFAGSISAEHGIGLQKRTHLAYSRTAEEIALMRLLKATLDPKNILNPGKVL